MSTQNYQSYFTTGKVRMLAIWANKRHPAYPNVPTGVEKGLKRTVAEVGMGLVGPKGLPPVIVKKWEEVLRQILKDPQVMNAIEKLDFVIHPVNGEQFKKEIVDEFAVFKQIAADMIKNRESGPSVPGLNPWNRMAPCLSDGGVLSRKKCVETFRNEGRSLYFKKMNP